MEDSSEYQVGNQSPNDWLAKEIALALTTQGLILPGDARELEHLLASGRMSENQWLIMIRRAIAGPASITRVKESQNEESSYFDPDDVFSWSD